MAEPKRVVVTGSSGKIGRVVCAALREQGHDVLGFDRVAGDGQTPTTVGDLTDLDALRHAFADADVVVHLAAYIFVQGDFFEDLLEPNVRGLYNVAEAVREAGVKRWVLASSINAVAGRLGVDVQGIGVDERWPVSAYGLTKVWAEDLGHMYARQYGVSVVAARIGWFPRDPEDAHRLARRDRGPREYVGYGDIARFFACAVEVPDIDFAVVYAVGPGCGAKPSPFDLEPGRRLLGYEPREVFPEGQPFEIEADV